MKRLLQYTTPIGTLIGGAILIFVVYISGSVAESVEKPAEKLPAMALDSSLLNFKQKVYVPVNAAVEASGIKIQNTVTTLKIRNTSMVDSLQIVHLEYYDAEGKSLQRFVDSAVLIKPLATLEVAVRNKNFATNADNFIVEWGGRHEKLSPIIEAITFDAVSKTLFSERGIVINDAR